jgi:hypothetical protein
MGNLLNQNFLSSHQSLRPDDIHSAQVPPCSAFDNLILAVCYQEKTFIGGGEAKIIQRHWSTFAEAIAVSLCTRAVRGNVAAAKEICERTEGRVPASVDVGVKIDYAAGQTAKEQLMKKSGGDER